MDGFPKSSRKAEGMDRREVKTNRSIINAFLELRAKKPLEKIRVKELAEAAQISKATFYLHYKDIYDLSEQLQKDLIRKIISAIPDPDQFLTDAQAAQKMLKNAFFSYQSLIDILFSGPQEALLPKYIEQGLKNAIFELNLSLKRDVRVNTTLSFLTLGGFYAYLNNTKSFPAEDVSDSLGELLAHYNTALQTVRQAGQRLILDVSVFSIFFPSEAVNCPSDQGY